MKHRHLIMLVAIVTIALAPASHAHANMAPPPPPSGGALDAGELPTYVQMMSENVLMSIGDDGADVKATFNMLNQGTEEEILAVRFPAGDHWTEEDGTEVEGWWFSPASFTVYVEGNKVGYTTTKRENDSRIWITWQVTFPLEKIVTVEVSYRASADYSPFPQYSYILETGAGWYGKIGEGTIMIRLPYEISENNTLEDLPPIPSYYTIKDTDIIWHFANLEPTREDNIFAYVMSPPLWREWQEAEKVVEENPDSVSAHLRLARALSDVSDNGFDGCSGDNCGRFIRALEEYKLWLNVIPDEYAVQVIPNIVEYHLDYIDLLWMP